MKANQPEKERFRYVSNFEATIWWDRIFNAAPKLVGNCKASAAASVDGATTLGMRTFANDIIE